MKALFRRLRANLDWYWVTFVWWAEVTAVSLPGFPKPWLKRLLAVHSSWVTSKIAGIALQKFSWSEDEFRELVGNVSEFMQEEFAWSPHASPAFLNILLRDANSSVRGTALSNPNVDWDEVRARLNAGEDLTVMSIIQNPDPPLDLLVKFSAFPYLEGRMALQKLEGMDDARFAVKLRELGCEELGGYPRAWVLKVIA